MQKQNLRTLALSVSAGAFLFASLILPLAASANSGHDERDSIRSSFSASHLGDQIRDLVKHKIDDKKKEICDRFANKIQSRFPWVKGPSFCRGNDGGNQNAPDVSITADPMVVTAGQNSTLSWDSENAVSCSASGGWSGAKLLSGSQVVTVNATTTYSLSCTNAKGTTTESVTVNVIPVVVPPPPAPTTTLNASPLTVQVGATSTLTWSSTNANACIASNGWSGSKATSGNQVVTVSATTTYTLACGNGMATDTKSVTVNATPLPPLPTPTVEITADPDQVASGDASILAWISTNATACEASNGWSGTKSLSGNTVVNPTATTTYTLACGNGQSTSTDSVTIAVYPMPTLTLSALPLQIFAGATSTLSWNSEFTTSCTASDGWTGSKSLSGNEIVSPNATTTYTLSCSGLGGIIMASTTVGVTPNPAPTPEPTLTFTGNPLAITAGATSTLTWSTTDATACTASNGWTGAKGTAGNEIVSPNATTTYHLSCSGAGGATSTDVTIGVTPAPAQNIGHMVLSEVYYDVGTGKGDEPGNEWVELFNGSLAPVDLNGWKLQDESGSFDTIATSSFMLAPNAYLLITSSSTTAGFWTIPSAIVVLAGPIGNALGNTVDSLTLMDSASTTIDVVSWGTATTTTLMVPTVPGVAAGHSIGRIQFTADSDTNADWGNFASPTPGQ